MALPSTNVNYVIIDPFDYPANNLDATGLYAAGNGFLAASSDGAQNWTDLTSGMGTPPNPHGDSPAPAASDLNYKFIVANPYSANEIIAQAEWTNTGGDYRSWVVRRDNSLTWTWTASASGEGGIDPETAGIGWLININPDNESYANNDAVTSLTNAGTGGNASGGTSPTFKTSVQNGRDAVLFDRASSEYLTFGTGLGKPANWTFIAALRWNFIGTISADRSTAFGSEKSDGASNSVWGYLSNDGASRLEYVFGDDTDYSWGVTATNTLVEDDWIIVAGRYTDGDTDVEYWTNATPEAIATVNSSAASECSGTAYDFALGRPGALNQYYFDGYLGRIYLDDTALSDAQIEGISVNLANYYGIEASATNETRELGLDIDRHGGTKLYIATFDGTNLVLQQRATSGLAVSVSTTLGASTLAQIAAYTYYANVFCPPAIFGDSSTVYVFGRWTDGTVRHLQKSTDGGATLSDIGDSATWGADYISAFFATDANTLFAFRAGTTKALYRSQDGGGTWDNLGSLPFNVARASLGADGRIAICNRDSGGAQVSIADGPLFSSWTNISGSLPTGGKGSIVWV